MSLSRRKFMGALGLGAVASVVPGCESDSGGTNRGNGSDAGVDAGPPLSEVPVDSATFVHGVASGDPFAESVLLWTRVTQEGTADAELTWVVARDPELRELVAMGEATATSERDFTVKVVAEGLEAGTTYYYAFFLNDTSRSTIGRTRTLPNDVEHVRLAFTSCANYGYGYFHAFRAIAQRPDLDVWLHLGDYIYEYGEEVYFDPELGRAIDPKHETVTLEDYRKRHARWRTDLDLQEIHRQHPLIVVWDDHEVANNAWADGAENHQPDLEGEFAPRKKAGIQAFLEWLPIRVEPGKNTPAIYRQFAFGKLFDLIMLDTRMIARDQQAGTDQINLDNLSIDIGEPEVWADSERTLLGDDQESWFAKALSDSKKRGATWRFIGNQIIFAKCKNALTSSILFSDFWDGYQADQQKVVDQIVAQKIDNVVFLTGDIHTSWVFEVANDPFTAENYDPESGEGAIAVEFVGPSVTSEAFESLSPDSVRTFTSLLNGGNPHLKFNDLTRKGYVLLDITDEQVQGEWYFVGDIKKKAFSESLAVAFKVASQKPHVVETKSVTKPKANPPAPAPDR